MIIWVDGKPVLILDDERNEDWIKLADPEAQKRDIEACDEALRKHNEELAAQDEG